MYQQQNSNKVFAICETMGPRSSRQVPTEIQNLSKSLLIQLAFPQIGQKFERAEFFYKTRQMKIHIPIDNQQVIKQWKQNIQILRQDEMMNYILLPKTYEFQKQGFCGSSGIAKVFLHLFRKIVYDYFPYSLEGQVSNHKKSIDNQEFQQAEIWKLLFTILKASSFMHKNWKKVGDIRPKYILYNEERQLRVSCQFSYPRQMTNFEKFIFQKDSAYLAPQQLHDIKMGRIEPNSTRNAKQHIIQSESWSIGLTMLHVVLLFDFSKIYDTINFEINFDLLQQKLTDLENKKNVSLALKNIIKSMLEQIPERRLLASELTSTYLFQYQEAIKKLQKFDTTQLNNQIKQLMRKKAENSLIGTIWKACSTGLIESLVINRKENQKIDTDARAKQTLMQELEKFSQIQPKNSQVSMRESIRLGRSKKKMTESNVVVIKQSQVSNQSFHTVGSMRFSKKDSNVNRIMGFEIQNRFGTQRLPTSGSKVSPQKVHNFDTLSDKFMTPLEQSSYFHTIHGNEKSFDFHSVGLLNSTFRNSQTIDDKNFLDKIDQKPNESRKLIIQGNFKKEKSKQKS